MTSELAAFVLALPCGFITDPAQLAELVRQDPHGLVLLRCGMGRLLCPAMDASHFRAIIEKEGSDYIRDLSVYPPTLALARHHLEAEATRARVNTRLETAAQTGEGLPSWHLGANPAPLAGCAPLPKIEPLPPLKYGPAPGCAELLRKHQGALNKAVDQAFDESQCGGAFDGHQVTSDADPGL